MQIIVQKYGGSSVATLEKLRTVARKVIAAKQRGNAVVVVVSAMGDSTDDLVGLARQLSPDPSRRELDVLLSTGEMATMSLLAIAIRELGEEAISMNGMQCGIYTNNVHSNARILEVRPSLVRKHLDSGAIVVVAGFQGFTSNGDVTTLGRGGSDTTAVALAAALKAKCCEIYTDVAGVFTADPRVVPQARYLKELNAAEMQELAWTGANVLKADAVEFASTNGVHVVVRSTFEDGHDTRVHPQPDSADALAFRPHRIAIAGVAGRKDVIHIVFGFPQLPNPVQEAIFDVVAGYDLIFCSAGGSDVPTELFLSNLEIPDPAAFVRKLQERFGSSISVTSELGAVSLVGFGLGSRPQTFLNAYQLLQRAGLPIVKSFTGRESFSFVVPIACVDDGVALMHEAFI